MFRLLTNLGLALHRSCLCNKNTPANEVGLVCLANKFSTQAGNDTLSVKLIKFLELGVAVGQIHI